jgi:hypothetical protein
VKAVVFTNFNPDQVTIITDAYELAKKRFVSPGPLAKVEEAKLARAIIILAEEGCLEKERLASLAIIAAKACVRTVAFSQ